MLTNFDYIEWENMIYKYIKLQSCNLNCEWDIMHDAFTIF